MAVEHRSRAGGTAGLYFRGMDRRDFLIAGAGLLATASRAATGRTNGLPGVAPRYRVGCAAITWGGNDPQAIDDVAAAGYAGIQLRASAVERWGAQSDTLRVLLKSRQLAFPVLSSGAVPFAADKLSDATALHVRNARFAKAAGCTYLQVTDERPRGSTPAPDDYARMGRALTELGARVADEGMTLVYHNHMGALGQAPDEVARILDAADDRRVKLLLDVAHWHAAGGDPVSAVTQYASRTAVVHLKDVERPRPGGTPESYRFRELGAGQVNLTGVLAALDRTRFAGWSIVELDGVPDPATAPIVYAKGSRAYLEAHGVRVTR
jgi:inosose dehydratase